MADKNELHRLQEALISDANNSHNQNSIVAPKFKTSLKNSKLVYSENSSENKSNKKTKSIRFSEESKFD